MVQKLDTSDFGFLIEPTGRNKISYTVRDKRQAAKDREAVRDVLNRSDNSLTAAATRYNDKQSVSLRRRAVSETAREWQAEAWDMYDQVGEHRFLATTLAGRVAQSRLMVGWYDDDGDLVELDGDNDPEEVLSILDAFGDTTSGRVQMIYRMAVNLFVAGEGWMVGIPQEVIDETHDRMEHPDQYWDVFGNEVPEDSGFADVDLDSIVWRFLSNDEVQMNQQDETITVPIDEAATTPMEFRADRVFLIRVWRPHPRLSHEADSPTRSVLPVLRELVGLTMHISAQIDSRLAGAGVLVVPESAKRAFKESQGLSPEDNSDPFTEALMESMTTPIADRADASAVVPMIVSAADESTDKFQHISFATPLDGDSKDLRDEAIRRLSLGLDAPPEMLLGLGSGNHWSSFLVREDTVSTHVEPVIALIADALTKQYLWPVLEQTTWLTEKERERYVIWYDVSHMVVRPNRSDSAMKLYEAGALSAEAVRDSTGFAETDAPEVTPADNAERAIEKALDLVGQAPTLLESQSFEDIASQIKRMLDKATPEPEPEQEPGDDSGENIEDGGSGPGQGPNLEDGGEAPTE